MRKWGLALIAVGAFLIVVAPMLRFYAYPRIAVAPTNQNSVTTLVGSNATIFDIANLREIQTDLTTKVRTVGDSEASEKADGNTIVWVSSSRTESSDGVMRSSDVERIAFDAHTAEAVNCCGEFISDTEGVNTPVEHEGLSFKFPFNTQKQTYDFWDANLRRAVPIQYRGTEKLEGMTVYKFEHTIEPTKVGDQELPLSLLGLDGDENVVADSMYSNVRTLWVEPNTGVIIDRTEQQNNTFDYDGEPRITTTKVTTSYDDTTVQKNIDDYKALGTQLKMLRSVVPLVSLIAGLLLLIGGFGLVTRKSRGTRYEP